MPLDDFIASISMAGTLDEQNKLHRSQGTAVFLAGNPKGTPNALIKNIKHNQILHRQNILLTIVTDPSRPHVPPEERVEVSDRTEGFFRRRRQLRFHGDARTSTKSSARPGRRACPSIATRRRFSSAKSASSSPPKPAWPSWREHLFVFLSKHSENAADFFQLPPDRVYEVSQVVEI